jgi:hypothetical protein
MTVTFNKLGQYGRRGNTMFQAATTIAHAIRNGDDFIFPQNKYQKTFNIPQHKFLRGFRFTNTYEEPHYHYAPIPYRKNMNLYGYFQSEKYFIDQKDIILKYLTPKHNFDRLSNSVSLHVRRGDYLQPHLSGCYLALDLEYYNKALDTIGGAVDKVFVFSDDIGWCEKHFVGPRYIFIKGNPAHVDMKMMSCCTHNIIANSSFSWWGAWLNTNPDKIVIAPKKWFGPKLAKNHDTKDLIPEIWTRI